MANVCGLRTVTNEPVPLKSVEVQVDVQGHVASVSSTLQYENQESSAVEAVFIFPMESNATIYSFVARIGDVEIKAQVKEKEQAQEEYDDAVSSGQQAFLLEESDESSDVFRLSVGSLPPGQSASVTLSYVTELAVQADDALRFCLPAVLNPQYTPAGSKSLTTEGSGPQGESVPYTLSLGVHIYSPSTVQSVQSNCPLTPLEFLSQDNTEAKVSLSPGHMFDRDVELLLYYGQPHQPTAILEAGQPSAQPGSLMGDIVAMLSFYPEIPSIPSSQMTSSGEFIFVVDRSGSMVCAMNPGNYKHTRISSARDTLQLLLKSLPVGCYFNIYSFGSSFKSYFPESVEYTQANMETAVQKVKSMQADMGGTEILQVLQDVYSKPCLPSHPHQLFVFTDGEVENTKAVIDLVKRHAFSHRCFTFGIGEGASSALVNGMAEGGSGHPQFIIGAERLQPKVMQSLQFALQPVVEDISVKWNIPADISVTPLSPLPNVLFQNQRAILYFQLTGQSSDNISGSVSLHYTLDKKAVENTLTLNMKPKEDSSMMIHRLGARKAILALEGERGEAGNKTGKERAVELSVQSGVSSSYTAFIAVNTENKQPIKGPLLRRNIQPKMLSALQVQCSAAAVPLKSVEVQVDVQGHVASVSSTLQYENQESSAVEAVFIFPMESNATIYSFVARIGDVEIKAQVKEKEQAQEEYDDAVSSGQQAFLLEESDESSDVFRLSVGSLPPGQNASVTLSYVTELAVQADDALRFCLPAVLNPRYTPAGSKSLTAAGSGPQGESVPYTLSLGVHIYSPSIIQSVQSNCPLTPLEFLSQDNTEAKVSLSPGHKFDRDVELLLYYGQPHQPTAILEAGQPSAQPGSLMGDIVAMLNFYPEIPSIPSPQMTSKGEFIFVVDRSGTMDCPMNQSNHEQTRISSARDTLLLLLKSLPVGCYFNIYGFGSSFKSYFSESVEYTQANMETAVQKVKSMQADMGGTEILQVLQDVYSKPCLPSRPRQLFVFTDGEVGNTKEVIDLVKRHALSHRCFTFGIGEGASSALVNGMAEGGSGHPQFITGAERLQPKVMQSLQFALQPVVEDISVKWNIPPDISVTPLSPLPNVLFQNQRAILYFQLTGQSSGNISGSVSLHYTLDKKAVENTLTLNMKPKEDSSMLIHRLGARKAILALEGERGEAGDKTGKERAVELSVQSGVSSSYTAFIAINTENKQPIKGPLLRRNIQSRMLSARQGGGLRMGARHVRPLQFGGGSLRMDARRVRPLQFGGGGLRMDAPETKDPLLELISLQRVDGSWDLQPSLASIFGKKEEEVATAVPGKAEFLSVWATVLAVLWLHGHKMDFKDEWQFVAAKAVAWIRAQSGADLTGFVAAGNSFLGLQVELQNFGLQE